MPMWEGEDGEPDKSDKTPKQKLLGWIQSKLPDKPVGNFTTDWNDGTTIGALVDAVAPGRCDVKSSTLFNFMSPVNSINFDSVTCGM